MFLFGADLRLGSDNFASKLRVCSADPREHADECGCSAIVLDFLHSFSSLAAKVKQQALSAKKVELLLLLGQLDWKY